MGARSGESIYGGVGVGGGPFDISHHHQPRQQRVNFFYYIPSLMSSDNAIITNFELQNPPGPSFKLESNCTEEDDEHSYCCPSYNCKFPSVVPGLIWWQAGMSQERQLGSNCCSGYDICLAYIYKQSSPSNFSNYAKLYAVECRTRNAICVQHSRQVVSHPVLRDVQPGGAYNRFPYSISQAFLPAYVYDGC